MQIGNVISLWTRARCVQTTVSASAPCCLLVLSLLLSLHSSAAPQQQSATIFSIEQQESNSDFHGESRFTFAPVISTNRFERPLWTSFSHIGPSPAAAAHSEFVIMLDPGHGGIDVGATAANGLLEKFVTLDIARRAALFLTEIPGIRVKMTRTEDIGMSRHRRVRHIRDADADLVISLHFNHLPQTNVNLVEAYYADAASVTESLFKQVHRSRKLPANTLGKSPSFNSGHLPSPLKYTENSQKLADIMQRIVYQEVKYASPESIDAGVKNNMLYVLTQSLVPATLLELSCISNPAEAERLTDPQYRNGLAAAITDGIREYLDSNIQIPSQVTPLKISHGELPPATDLADSGA